MEQTISQPENKFANMLRDPARFQKREDGWIRDNLLGLDWGPSSDEIMPFGDALAYCDKLGGRLPEINEIQSLVDYSKKSPAINEVFADVKTDDWYWSGTEVAGHPGNAWCVSFSHGNVNWIYKDCDSYVRPVRASQ